MVLEPKIFWNCHIGNQFPHVSVKKKSESTWERPLKWVFSPWSYQSRHWPSISAPTSCNKKPEKGSCVVFLDLSLQEVVFSKEMLEVPGWLHPFNGVTSEKKVFFRMWKPHHFHWPLEWLFIHGNVWGAWIITAHRQRNRDQQPFIWELVG